MSLFLHISTNSSLVRTCPVALLLNRVASRPEADRLRSDHNRRRAAVAWRGGGPRSSCSRPHQNQNQDWRRPAPRFCCSLVGAFSNRTELLGRFSSRYWRSNNLKHETRARHLIPLNKRCGTRKKLDTPRARARVCVFVCVWTLTADDDGDEELELLQSKVWFPAVRTQILCLTLENFCHNREVLRE